MARLTRLGAVFLITFLVGSTARAAVSALPGGSSVGGKSIADYTADWWNWDGSFANGSNPFSDKTGAIANDHQSGPVFFIAGTTSTTPGAVSRNFSVPNGAYLLVPLLNIVIANGADPGFATTAEEAKLLGDTGFSPAKMFASLDGIAIPDLASHREDSPNFTLHVLSADSPVAAPMGDFSDAFASGYYLMFAPLSPGVHTLIFGGTSNSFDTPTNVHLLDPYSVNVTDTITVLDAAAVPLPPARWPALAILIGIALRVARPSLIRPIA
jgi:hypothetical protein